jgi:CDGSH-type Zn-finger protein
MSGDPPRIVVGRDGPYRVTGPVRVLRTAIVETEYGEPVDWDEGPDFKTPSSGLELCRCGRSSRKPFCDATHEREPFDGTEVADRAPSAERRLAYEGDGVVMTDDRDFCTHAGFCGDRFTTVWVMIHQTEDPAIRERLKEMVRKCPSGRLAYSVPESSGAEGSGSERDDVADEEPAYVPPSIGIEPNGPIWVRGGIPVESEDGTSYEVRNRVTLCRCGQSRNKPFCDGSHKVAGFRDPAMPKGAVKHGS